MHCVSIYCEDYEDFNHMSWLNLQFILKMFDAIGHMGDEVREF